MNLSDDQKESVAGWVAEGLKLSEIQSRINENFDVTLTFMDVRFLIDDLELEIKDQPRSVDKNLLNSQPPSPSENPVEDASGGLSEAEAAPGSSVSVSLHKLYKPGAVVSGNAVFSDGEQAEWSLDQIGRLALNPATEGYQPSESDLQEFQKELSMILQNRGF